MSTSVQIDDLMHTAVFRPVWAGGDGRLAQMGRELLSAEP